jgi:hypothetical protein
VNQSQHQTTDLPEFFRVRQRFASHALPDVDAAVTTALRNADLSGQVHKGQSVAIAIGSRGIADIAAVAHSLVRYLQTLGAAPFIVPAMGSHGGATDDGQAAVLASYGIDEPSIGCPVRSSMETVVVGATDDGVQIHFDKIASAADHVIVVNRIKPHTRLVGQIESGIVKMLMIGLGKHRGALTYHQAFPNYDYYLDRIAAKVVPLIVANMPITLGLAIVEDAYDRVSLIEAIKPTALLTEEPRLLKIAREWMPRLPFDHADLLIIDRIGKEISGSGMDTNVVGRKSNDREAAPAEFPKIRQIFVRALTKKTNGNATGIGIAEYCRAQVVQDMNVPMTRINCVTSGHVTAGAIPVYFDTDREVLEAALTQARQPTPAGAKWMHIPDTLHLSEVACSVAYRDALSGRDDLELMDEARPLQFDSLGNLSCD